MNRFVKFLLHIVTLIVGCYVALQVGGAAFFSTSKLKLMPYAQPLAAAVVAAFVLSLIRPGYSRSIALCVAMPMLFMAAVMEVGLLAEGRADWGWLYLAGAVLAVSFAGAWVARKLR